MTLGLIFCTVIDALNYLISLATNLLFFPKSCCRGSYLLLNKLHNILINHHLIWPESSPAHRDPREIKNICMFIVFGSHHSWRIKSILVRTTKGSILGNFPTPPTVIIAVLYSDLNARYQKYSWSRASAKTTYKRAGVHVHTSTKSQTFSSLIPQDVVLYSARLD